MKKNRFILCTIYNVLSYLFFFIAIKKIYMLNFSYDLLFFFTILNLFISCHFLFNIKKLYDIIYKKRYIIGFISLFILVAGKYNGSSVEIWNSAIEPSYKVDSGIIVGIPRSIRSDEWLVSTPVTLTQATEEVNFSSINNILSAHDNLVMLYPNLPSKDISILSTPNNLGYLFLDVERAFSLSWYLPYFILFFASFELFMIITKKNRLYSLAGSIAITLSPVVMWWQSPNIIAYGSVAIVLFYYFLNSNNWVKKLLLSICFGYSGYLYIMCMYPAWQVPYGYVYLVLILYTLYENYKKIKIKDFLYLIPVLLVIVIPLVLIFKSNLEVLNAINSTVYPGERMSTGGGEWRLLFTYVMDIFYPYYNLGNPCEFSQYLSLFPLPIIYSIYIIIKNKKLDLFLILSNIILIFLSIWVIFPLPEFISKITLIYMSTEARCQVAIGYLSVIVIFYIISHYQQDSIKGSKFIKLIISICLIFITVKISNSLFKDAFNGYANLYTSIISLAIFSVIGYLFIINYKKTNTILAIVIICLSVLGGIIVSPVNKGLSVLYDKPVAKKINELVKENKDKIYLTIDNSILTSNYLSVNGAHVIDTVNYVPNLNLYYKLDEDRKYENVYNRYEHISVDLIEEETNFELVQDDLIKLNINFQDVCKIGVDYLVDNTNRFDNDVRMRKIYGIDNVYLYEINCNYIETEMN